MDRALDTLLALDASSRSVRATVAAVQNVVAGAAIVSICVLVLYTRARTSRPRPVRR